MAINPLAYPVLVLQHRDIDDPDHGGQYTIKTYRRRPEARYKDDEQRETIVLEPANPAYDPIALRPEQADELRIVGELVEVLAPQEAD